MKRSRIAIIALTIVVTIGVGGAFVMGYLSVNPQKEFQKEFGFSLPKTAEIVNYEYYHTEESLYIKIVFDKTDLGYFETNFLNYYKGDTEVGNDEMTFAYSDLSWWDPSQYDIVFAHQMLSSGKKVKTRSICTYIAEGETDKYLLYVVC